jgi:hypothetical protein
MMSEPQIVYIVQRVDIGDGQRIIWKVYDTEEKAKRFCDGFNKDEFIIRTQDYRFMYEEWQVR